jgi:dimethylhistidine N-methyltransferase
VIRRLTKYRRLERARSVGSLFRSEVIAGLSAEPRRLPCKYFYDERGSSLFEAICHLDEYYLTRTELEIMNRHSARIARAIGIGATLVEFGSGSSVKTRLLLDHLVDSAAYIPLDISRKHLLTSARRLSLRYPKIAVLPICADFTENFDLPRLEKPSRRIVYFPGSTIGNFERKEAVALLNRIAKLCAPDGGALIGIDLQKDVATIEAAYNDAQGITAQFNLNLLMRINRELGGNFDLEQFEHLAFYDQATNRVDIRLVSRSAQCVEIGSEAFDFCAGDAIHTEYSHKYTIEEFERMANRAGLRLRHCWTDNRRYFAVVYFDLG